MMTCHPIIYEKNLIFYDFSLSIKYKNNEWDIINILSDIVIVEKRGKDITDQIKYQNEIINKLIGKYWCF